MEQAFDTLLHSDLPATATQHPRRLRGLLTAVLPLALIGAGLAVYLSGFKPRVTDPVYRTHLVDRGAVSKTVTASGTLSARVTVTVGAQVSGRIQDLYVDYNTRVKKGQVIARIDPKLLAAEVARANANLAAAHAKLAQSRAATHEAKLQYERDRALAKKAIVATADVETKRAAAVSAAAEVQASLAAVAQAQATLKLVGANLGYATIISPIDGVVVSRSVDIGQTVAASLQAPTLFTIAQDLKRMEVHTSVAESDVGLIKEGMVVEFTVDAYPKEIFRGVVKQVRYEAQTVQNVVTYDAVVSVDNDALKLRPGMTANATFIIAKRENVLRVTAAATRWRPAGTEEGRGKRTAATKGERSPNKRRVFVLRDGEQKPERVELGLSDGKYFELLSGALKEGDQLIIAVDDPNAKAGAANAKARPAGRRRIL